MPTKKNKKKEVSQIRLSSLMFLSNQPIPPKHPSFYHRVNFIIRKKCHMPFDVLEDASDNHVG